MSQQAITIMFSIAQKINYWAHVRHFILNLHNINILFAMPNDLFLLYVYLRLQTVTINFNFF